MSLLKGEGKEGCGQSLSRLMTFEDEITQPNLSVTPLRAFGSPSASDPELSRFEASEPGC